MDTDQKLNHIIALLSNLSSSSDEKVLNSIKESIKTLQIERSRPEKSEEKSSEMKTTIIDLRKKNIELKSRVKELEGLLLNETRNPTEEELKNDVSNKIYSIYLGLCQLYVCPTAPSEGHYL